MDLENELLEAGMPLPHEAPSPGHVETDDDRAVAAKETRLAFINAIKLSLSLLSTLVVAVVIRILIPRYIAPGAFGQVNFADAYAMSFFAFTSFGVDGYIRKEVSTRPEHANDFWSGFLVVRLLTAVLVSGMMAVGLQWMHKGPLEWQLSFIFAIGQIAFVHNLTVQALLHASSEVNELAWMNVGSKIIWGGGILLSLVLHAPLDMIAVVFCISEGLKAFYLSWVARRKLHLRWNVNFAATKTALIASAPYFLNYICINTYQRLNITMLSSMTNDKEVGWFSSSQSLAGFSLLFVPILTAVVVPMAARTAAKSTDAMNEIMRGAVRLMVVIPTLISLILMLNAQTIVDVVFKADYHEAAMSLRMLAPMFPLTYLTVLGATHLIQLNRIGMMMKISLAALIINPLLNGPLISYGYHHMSAGSAGGMSALASIFTEGGNAAIMFFALGRAAVDKRFWQVVGKTLAICAAVAAIHYSLPSWQAWRIPLEICVYVALALGTGALPAADIRRMVSDAVAARRSAKDA